MKLTRYCPPHGRREAISIEIGPKIEALAIELGRAGWSFEVAPLSVAGMVHLDCCNEDEQLAADIVPDGPRMCEAVSRLVQRAYEEWGLRGRPSVPATLRRSAA